MKTTMLGLTAMGSLLGISCGFDLAGTWHVSGLDIPGAITQHKNAEGVVVGLNGSSQFDVADGTLTISETGAVSGVVGQTVSGTASVSADGLVSLALTAPDPMTITLSITSTSDLMATSHGASDFHELLVMAKAPANATAGDLVGSWWVMELQTPAAISLQYDGTGKAINVNGTQGYRQTRRLVVISEGGRYNFNSGEQFGSLSVNASGAMTLTPDDSGSPTLQFHMNAGRDVMINANQESDSRDLVVLVKQHAVNDWEAAGNWSMCTLDLPGHLNVSDDNNGHVLNIDGLEGFRHMNGGITFSLDGSLAGHLEGSFAGNTLSTTDGTLPIYHGEPAPFTGAVNAGGDFLVGVDDGGSLEMLVAVRSVRPLAVAMLPGSPLRVAWVPGPGRYLQEADATFVWHTLAGSEAMSSYLPIPAVDGPQHFYRLAVP